MTREAAAAVVRDPTATLGSPPGLRRGGSRNGYGLASAIAGDTAARAPFATGLPSASTMLTSPIPSARTGCSICLRSPTTTQVTACGSIVFAACATCAAVSDSTSALRLKT